MFYVNFEEHITMRYGIIVKNWPLKRFAAPGSLSRVELEVLLHAFKNKLTTFRELDDEEWVDWKDAYRRGLATMFDGDPTASLDEEVQSPATSAAAAPDPGPGPAPTSAAAAPPAPTSAAAAPPAPAPPAAAPLPAAAAPPAAALGVTLNFINAVTNADGSALIIPKRARKPRAQKASGKRKRGNAEPSTHAQKRSHQDPAQGGSTA